MKKKILIGISILLLVLILTNPTLQDFKENIGFKESKDNSVCKKYNFLLISFYEYHYTTYEEKAGGSYSNSHCCYYLGIFKNFIWLDYSSSGDTELL